MTLKSLIILAVSTLTAVSVSAAAPTIYGLTTTGSTWAVSSTVPASGAKIKTEKLLDGEMMPGLGYAYAGAVYFGSRYYVIQNFMQGGKPMMFNTLVFNEDWIQVNTLRLNAEVRPVTMAYRNADETIYGVFDMTDGFVLGTFDVNNGGAVTTIATLPQKVVAIDFTPQNELIGIGIDGTAYRINPSSGALTKIGSTGIEPGDESQDLCADPATGRLYWLTPEAIYEVSTTTGAATKLTNMDGATVWAGAFIKPAEKEVVPSWVDNLTLDFDKDSLTGRVNFTMPTVDDSGKQLSGELEYQVWADETLAASGTSAPGATVSVNAAVAESGMHSFRVIARKNSINGMESKITRFIGHDVPSAPTALTVANAGNLRNVTVSWNSVTEGVNGGWIDVDNIRYTLVRQPDNVTVASATSATSVTDTSVAQMGYYTYTLTASDGQFTSSAAVTPSVLIGENDGIQPPWAYGFGAAGLGLFSAVDGNSDGLTWAFDAANSVVWCRLSASTQADDWLMTPGISLEKGKFYPVTISISGSYYNELEILEVKCGSRPVPAAMTETALKATEFVGQRNFSFMFSPAEGGIQNFGLHVVSPAANGAVLITEFGVGAGIDGRSPSAVTLLSAKAADLGAMKATVSFTTPTLDFSGASLSGKADVIVTNLTTGATISAGLTANSGQAVTVTDNNPAPGINEYSVVCANAYGAGPATKTKVWVGPDITAAPSEVRWTANSDGTVTVKWTACTKGEHGGYVDFNALEYIVYHRETEQILYRGKELTATLTPVIEDRQEPLRFYVCGVNSANEAGTFCQSNYAPFGTPYQLPLEESFAGAGTGTTPWMLNYVSGNNPWYALSYLTDVTLQPFDNDGGMLVYTPIGAGKSWIETPLVDMTASSKPVMKFWQYMFNDYTAVSVLGSSDSGNNWKKLHTVVYDSSRPGWNLVTADLSPFAGKSNVILAIEGEASAAGPYVIVDNVTVGELADVDPMISAIDIPAKAQAGKTYTARVTVANNGGLTLKDYSIVVSHNSVCATTVAGPSLAPDQKTTIEIEVPVSPNASGNMAVEVAVVHTLDAEPDNNSLSAATSVTPSYLPKPGQLTMTADSETATKVALSWGAPATVYNAPVFDDLESYESGSVGGIDVTYDYTARTYKIGKTTGAIGPYTLVDNDTMLTSSLIGLSHIPHVNDGMACQLLDVAAYNLGGHSVLAPHSGNKFFCFWQSMTPDNDFDLPNDDWLILPELSADDKNIAFWAKSITDKYGLECFDIMVSSTGTALADFKIFTTVKNVKAGYSTSADAGYTLYEFQLPASTRFAALRYNAAGTSGLLVDDITYTPVDSRRELTLIGYNVYRNDVLVNASPLQTTSFTDIITESGDYRYNVTALFDLGESSYSNEVTHSAVVQSDLDDVDIADAIEITAETGTIVIKAPEGLTAEVFTIDGRLLRRVTTLPVTRLPLSAGLYVVKVANTTAKITL